MKKISINKSMVRLSPAEFEKWFKTVEALKGEDWEKHYKAIGGKIEKPKKKE